MPTFRCPPSLPVGGRIGKNENILPHDTKHCPAKRDAELFESRRVHHQCTAGQRGARTKAQTHARTVFSPLPPVNDLGAGGISCSPDRRASRSLFFFSALRSSSSAFFVLIFLFRASGALRHSLPWFSMSWCCFMLLVLRVPLAVLCGCVAVVVVGGGWWRWRRCCCCCCCCRQTDRQAHRQAGTQTGRHTDKQYTKRPRDKAGVAAAVPFQASVQLSESPLAFRASYPLRQERHEQVLMNGSRPSRCFVERSTAARQAPA